MKQRMTFKPQLSLRTCLILMALFSGIVIIIVAKFEPKQNLFVHFIQVNYKSDKPIAECIVSFAVVEDFEFDVEFRPGIQRVKGIVSRFRNGGLEVSLECKFESISISSSFPTNLDTINSLDTSGISHFVILTMDSDYRSYLSDVAEKVDAITAATKTSESAYGSSESKARQTSGYGSDFDD